MAPLNIGHIWVKKSLLLYVSLLLAAQQQLISVSGDDVISPVLVAAGPPQSSSSQGTVKKELRAEPPPPNVTPDPLPAEIHEPLTGKAADADNQNVVVISERTLQELQADKEKEKHAPVVEQQKATAATAASGVEEAHYRSKWANEDDEELSDSFRTGIYLVMGLSSAAVLFIVVKVYRLRLSRAERKYGVQGDRSNQELTPLPVAIEDGNSDDDDHTLFEIDRSQMRIL